MKVGLKLNIIGLLFLTVLSNSSMLYESIFFDFNYCSLKLKTLFSVDNIFNEMFQRKINFPTGRSSKSKRTVTKKEPYFQTKSKAKIQKVKVINASPVCKIKRETVFFEHIFSKIENYYDEPIKTKNKVIRNSDEFIVANSDGAIKSVLNSGGIFIDKKDPTANLIFRTSMFPNRNLYYKSKRYQITNKNVMMVHFRGKHNFHKRYAIYKKKFPEDFDFAVPSYVWPQDKQKIEKIFKNYHQTKDNIWIIKPVMNHASHGIKFLESYNDIIHYGKQFVLNKYIPNPMLLKGKKFDMRLMILVTDVNPLKIYLFNEGMVRLSVEDYVFKLGTLLNKMMHFTNRSLNILSPKYNRGSQHGTEGHIWTMNTLRKYLEEKGINFRKMWEDTKDAAIKFFTMYTKDVVEIQMKRQINHLGFALWGMDVMYDENGKVYVIECNGGPDLNWAIGWVRRIMMQIVRDSLNIAGIYSVDKSYKDNNPKLTEKDIVDESICEFTRPMGGYERLFPRLSNINKYKKYLKSTKINKMLWNEMKRLNLE